MAGRARQACGSSAGPERCGDVSGVLCSHSKNDAYVGAVCVSVHDLSIGTNYCVGCLWGYALDVH